MAQIGISHVKELHIKIQQCQNYIKSLRNLASARNVIDDERDNWTANGSQQAITQRIMLDFNRKITELESEYSKSFNELVQCVNMIMTNMGPVVRHVLDGPFTTWRLDQKMAQVGRPENAELRQQAEASVHDVTLVLYALWDILAQMQSSYSSSMEIMSWLDTKRTECRRCIYFLVQKSFVVYKQPAMLVKDWTLRMDISAKVMADVPTYGTNKVLRRGPVFCCMIPEKQAEWLRLQQSEVDFSQAPINSWSFGYLSHGLKQREMARENCIKAEWNDASGEAEFLAVRTKIENRKTNESKDKAARIEMDQRPSDKKNDKMTEKKLYFLFFCQVHIDDEMHWIWTLSLPFLVAVQTMQEWHLLGVIFWDTAFSALDAVPCDGRPEVTWKELAIALKWLFDKEVQSDRGDVVVSRELTNEELGHLGTRIFGHRQPFNDDSIVRRSDIFTKSLGDAAGKKDPATGQILQKGFTFWQWFYACMDLLQDKSGKILRYHNGKCRKRAYDEKRTMATLFNEGIIRGFVSRDASERLLKSCRQTNIMIIRFSDNHCRHEDPNSVPAGYLSITCKTPKDGRDTIVNIKPLNRELLSRLTLPFVVAHCEYLNSVNYIYVGEDRWVDKKRLTVNYIPILTEYTQYEGYEKLLLNLNNDDQSDDNAVADIPSWTSSPQGSCRRSTSYSAASTPPAFNPSVIHYRTQISPMMPPINSPLFAGTQETPKDPTRFRISDHGGRPDSMAPSHLIELLAEAPSRRAAIPSKYDEVLSYLISDSQSPSSTSNVDFQPEDDAALFRSLRFS